MMAVGRTVVGLLTAYGSHGLSVLADDNLQAAENRGETAEDDDNLSQMIWVILKS